MADKLITAYAKLDSMGLTVYVSQCIDGHIRDIGRYTWLCVGDGASSHRSFNNELECIRDAKDYLAYTYQDIKRKDVQFDAWD